MYPETRPAPCREGDHREEMALNPHCSLPAGEQGHDGRVRFKALLQEWPTRHSKDNLCHTAGPEVEPEGHRPGVNMQHASPILLEAHVLPEISSL